jgi:hypothetical protein
MQQTCPNKEWQRPRRSVRSLSQIISSGQIPSCAIQTETAVRASLRSRLSGLIAFKVIPITTLFRRSHVFHDDNSRTTDVSVAKSLSSHANGFFDIQMIIVDKKRPRNLAGGYEIRRKDWAEVTLRFPSFSPEYWDARTVYIVRRVSPNFSLNLYTDGITQENIPHQYRSIVGICNLLRPILNSSPIQHIVFPPHHQDPPDAVPKCKGFALVTLTEPTVVSHLLTLFPYETDDAHDDDENSVSSIEESEARKAGFRALSKERWDKLQAEYAEYRESLLSRIAVDATAGPVPNKINSTHGSESTLGSAPAAQPAPAPPKPQSYPAGCVLFARHVPPDTNKTALRTRFSALLADAAALDYVDYTKGLDSVRPSPLSVYCCLVC